MPPDGRFGEAEATEPDGATGDGALAAEPAKGEQVLEGGYPSCRDDGQPGKSLRANTLAC